MYDYCQYPIICEKINNAAQVLIQNSVKTHDSLVVQPSSGLNMFNRVLLDLIHNCLVEMQHCLNFKITRCFKVVK